MNYKFLQLLPLLLLFFISSSGNAQTENATETGSSSPEEVMGQQANAPAESDIAFADPITDKVFQDYLLLQNALVNSDAGEASQVATAMISSLAEVHPAVQSIAQRIAESNDLAEQRSAFAELSTAVEPFFTEGIETGAIYKLHCMMAGADWFSAAKEVRNPYYGDKMLSCGKVTQEITN